MSSAITRSGTKQATIMSGAESPEDLLSEQTKLVSEFGERNPRSRGTGIHEDRDRDAAGGHAMGGEIRQEGGGISQEGGGLRQEGDTIRNRQLNQTQTLPLIVSRRCARPARDTLYVL